LRVRIRPTLAAVQEVSNHGGLYRGCVGWKAQLDREEARLQHAGLRSVIANKAAYTLRPRQQAGEYLSLWSLRRGNVE
jgi:hypothetical protein